MRLSSLLLIFLLATTNAHAVSCEITRAQSLANLDFKPLISSTSATIKYKSGRLPLYFEADQEFPPYGSKPIFRIFAGVSSNEEAVAVFELLLAAFENGSRTSDRPFLVDLGNGKNISVNSAKDFRPEQGTVQGFITGELEGIVRPASYYFDKPAVKQLAKEPGDLIVLVVIHVGHSERMACEGWVLGLLQTADLQY